MDSKRLKELVSDKKVAIEKSGDVVRVNTEIGNDNTWTEFEINNRNEIEMAALINAHVTKRKTGRISKL